jgi:hypothetical protein
MLPGLTSRASTEGHELLAFSDQDTLRALDAITSRRPARVTLEQGFAATPRGAALIKRIKADPSLAAVDVRVVDSQPEPDAATTPGPVAAIDAVTDADDLAAATASFEASSLALDPVGTRRAPRVNLGAEPEVLIDGNPASLVDLSAIGAQVLSPTVLKPNQRVRVALSDPIGTVRMNGTIIWACFEIPPNVGPRYRAGIEFAGGDSHAIAEYCERHLQS